MKKPAILLTIILIVFSVSFAALASMQDDDKKSKSKRVRRPKISKSDTVYFKNLFTEGLVGDRPDPASRMVENKSNQKSQNNIKTSENSQNFGWSKILTKEAIEGEIKSLSNLLNQHVTSPGKFKSGGNREVRQISSMVAMMFAIIAEYDGDVKWKEIAAGTRDSFAQCAQSSSTTSTQAYQQAKNRRDDLQQILSGGQFTPAVKPAEDFEWASVADVSELMKRLKSSYREKVKPWVGSSASYKSNVNDLMQEAAILAAIGEVLKKETMENADNDDYAEYATALKQGALMILESKATGDQEMAAKGAGMIDQSCQNCHADYN